MGANILDPDKLDEIFNLGSDSTERFEEPVIDIVATTVDSSKPAEPPKESSDFIDDEMKTLLSNANGIFKAAKYLIDTSPDAETVASASALIGSITSIISEFNKSILMTKRFKLTKELEDHKQKQKLEILQQKANQLKLDMGKGNTYNTQINQLVPFNQESIVKTILQEQQQKQLEAVN